GARLGGRRSAAQWPRTTMSHPVDPVGPFKAVSVHRIVGHAGQDLPSPGAGRKPPEVPAPGAAEGTAMTAGHYEGVGFTPLNEGGRVGKLSVRADRTLDVLLRFSPARRGSRRARSPPRRPGGLRR